MSDNQNDENEDKTDRWLLNEYHELHEEILHRRRNTWFVISILIAGTFVISFTDSSIWASVKYLLSLFLVLFSWFLWFSAQKVNAECWNDRHKIEDTLKRKMNQARKARLDNMFTHKIRKFWWHLLYLSLSLFYFHMLFYEILSALFACLSAM